MEAIRETEKKYCSRALLSAIILGGAFMACGLTAMGKGLILGCLFSIINFIALGGTIPMRIGRSGKTAFTISLGSLLARLLLMAAPMAIALKTTEFHLITTVFGLFLVQLNILADYLSAPLIAVFHKKMPGDIKHG